MEIVRFIRFDLARFDRVDVARRQQPCAFRCLLHEIELVEATVDGMVVRERVLDAHAMRVQRVQDVRAHLRLPRQQNAAVGIALGRAATGRVGYLRIPVGANERRQLQRQSLRHRERQERQRTIALPMYVGLTETERQLIAQTLDLMMTRTWFRNDDSIIRCRMISGP